MGELVVASPDVGGVARARALAKKLDNAELVIVDKRREKAGVSEVMNIIGDVEGRDVIICDDIVDSAGTLCNAAKAIKAKGAKTVSAYITHGVLSGKAVARIHDSVIDSIYVTDTIPLSEAAGKEKKIKVVSIATLIASAIKNISEETSISALFDN
jgi:ribose-phosphate pyrophosphokinase